ncbi:MAG: hypothetical protein ABDI07_01990 [Candidatus Kryptonium sp.]
MRKNFRFPKILSIALVFIIAVIFYACEDFSEIGTPPTLGTQVDFSRVVAIGNSITAGYQDGALFEGAQQYSYPNLIVQQINKTFGTNTAFVQPLIAEPGLGTRLRLTSLTPLQLQSQTVAGSPKNSGHTAPFNNLAVPGAILFDVFDTTDFAAKAVSRNNPFFQIVLRSRTLGPTMFHQARALNPTFVFFWTAIMMSLVMLQVVEREALIQPENSQPQNQFSNFYSDARLIHFLELTQQ